MEWKLGKFGREQKLLHSKKTLWLVGGSDVYSASRWRLDHGVGGSDRQFKGRKRVTMLTLGVAWFMLKVGSSCANGHSQVFRSL